MGAGGENIAPVRRLPVGRDASQTRSRGVHAVRRRSAAVATQRSRSRSPARTRASSTRCAALCWRSGWGDGCIVGQVPIEDNIKKLCPFVSNVMMVGDKRKFNTALITLVCEGATGELAGTNKLAGAAKALDSACSTAEEARASAAFKAAIEAAIKATNNDPTICQVPPSPARGSGCMRVRSHAHSLMHPQT